MSDLSHDIEKYLKGELTAAERHALEKKALNDPFLADALEGAEQIEPGDFIKDVGHLNQQLAGKKTVSVWMWTARIAAGLAFIVVATFIVWNILETEPQRDLALKENERVQNSPASKDSASSISGEVSPSPVEQPAAGPSISDKVSTKKDVTKQATPAKTESTSEIASKPSVTPADVTTKNEPVTEAVAAREAEEKAKADELKITESKVAESLAQNEKAAQGAASYRAKAEDDRDEKTRNLSKKKAVAADKEAAAPSAADSQAGVGRVTNIIQGQVTSAEDGSALPGVNVIVKGSSIGTVTDEHGNYQLQLDNTNATLLYSFIGLQSKEVPTNNQQQINVEMLLDVSQLSEIVVSGYAKRAEETVTPTVELAHPEIGNRAYKQYLEKNIRYPEQAQANKTEGRVTVEFTIEPNGSLTNFAIIRGIGNGCDEELIRLIKDGPKWIPTKKDNVPVQDKAKVRLKFELPE